MKIIMIMAMLLLMCSCSEQIINIGGDIHSKTTIKSKKVCLDNMTVKVNDNHELVIQCKKLIVNENTVFGGKEINVTIEYSRIKGKKATSITASDATSTLILRKKKIHF